MLKSTNRRDALEERGKLQINKGIELMLPRGRREPKSQIDLDRSFHFFKWQVRLRVKMDITCQR
jgi:hypothetical protein